MGVASLSSGVKHRCFFRQRCCPCFLQQLLLMFYKHNFASANLSECLCTCVHKYTFNEGSKSPTTTNGNGGEGLETTGQASRDSTKPPHHSFVFKLRHHMWVPALLHKFCNTLCSPSPKEAYFPNFKISVPLCSHWKLNVSTGCSA